MRDHEITRSANIKHWYNTGVFGYAGNRTHDLGVTDLVVAAGVPPAVEPVLEAVGALPEDVVPRRVPLNLPLDGLLHLRVQEAVEDGQKDSLQSRESDFM